MKTWSGIILGITAMAAVLCLTGMVMSAEALAQRFVDNGDGTVTDTATNLMWTKNADPIGKRQWNDAMFKAISFSISGIGGWRMPSKNELLALHQALKGGHPFEGIQSAFYWSNTTDGGFTWYVDMYYGYKEATSSKGLTAHMWPVRAGQ